LNLNTVALSSLAWSPDGSTLASISYEGTPILWDPFTSNQFRILPTKYGNQNSAWSPRGDLLGISNESGVVEVTLWNPQTGEAELTHKRVQDLAWSPLADIVASISDNGTGYGGDDTTVVLWDPRTGEEVRSFNVGVLLHDLDWSPDGEYLVASAGYSLMVLDAMTGEQLHNFKGHYNVATRVTWSPRGDFIASTAPDGTIIIWRIGQ
jgi:WD40 repeat protein